MTRKEALNYFYTEFDGEDTWLCDVTVYSYNTFINKIYNDFEQRIKELEDELQDYIEKQAGECI